MIRSRRADTGRPRGRALGLLRRSLVWTLLSLAAIVALAFCFQRPLLRAFVLPRLERAAADSLGLELTLESAWVDPLGRLTLSKLSLEGANPTTGLRSISLDRATVDVSIRGLLAGRDDWLESVRLESPRLELDFFHDPVLPETGEPGPEAGARPSLKRLPGVQVTGGDFLFLLGPERIALHGVDVSLADNAARVRVAAAEGPWRPPRIEALGFPVEVEARLEGRDEPWRRIRIARVTEGVALAVRDFTVDLADLQAIGLGGEFPSRGVRMTSGTIGRGAVDLTFDAQASDLRSVVSLFTDWAAPRALGTGRLRMVIPIGDASRWSVETSMELADVEWAEEGLRAHAIRADVRRGPDAVLAGEVLAVGLEGKGIPGLDATARFRRLSTAGEGSRVIVEDAAVWRGAGGVRFGLTFDEERRWIRDGLIEAAAFPLADGLGQGWEGSVDGEARFEFPADDLALLEGDGSLRLRGVTKSGAGFDAGGAAFGRVGGCQAYVRGEGSARGASARFEGGFDLGAGSGGPEVIVLERLDVTTACADVVALEPQRVERVDGAWLVGPLESIALGGEVMGWVVIDESGEVVVQASVEGVDLARIGEAASAGVAIGGRISGEAFLDLGPALDGGGIEPEGMVFARVEGASIGSGSARVFGIGLEGHVGVMPESLELPDLRLWRGLEMVEAAVRWPVEWTPFPRTRGAGQLEVSVRGIVEDLAELPWPEGFAREVGGRVIFTGSVRSAPGSEPTEILESGEIEVRATVLEGSVKRFGDAPPLTGIDADLSLRGGKVTLASLKGKARDAEFSLKGGAEVVLPWKEGGPAVSSVDVQLDAKGVLLVRSPDLRVRGDVSLAWKGPWQASDLSGVITVTRAYYLQDVSLVPRRRARLPMRLFSIKEAPFDSARLDVRVKSNRGIVLRNNVVSTRATADLVLGGTGLEPTLTGTVSTDEGRVRIADTSLELRGSIIEFVEEDPLNPRLQISIGETIRDYRVSVVITGTLDEPEVLLDSTPPLEREKVLVLITTGLTMEEIDERGVGKVAAMKAAKYVGLRAARYFSSGDPTEHSFLERFSLETESARTSQYEDPIRVEYRITDGVLLDKDQLFLQGERDTYGDYNFNLGLRFDLD